MRHDCALERDGDLRTMSFRALSVPLDGFRERWHP
jgi:hypothetical protein